MTVQVTKEQMAELTKLAGGDQQLANGLVALAKQLTQKAESQGITLKSVDDATLAALLGTPVSETKASDDTETDVEETEVEVETKADDPAMATESAEMSDDEFFNALADVVVTKVMAAIGPMLDLEGKMKGYATEMKDALAAITTKGVSEQTQAIEKLTALITDVSGRVATLEGDQPGSSGFRPSQDERTVTKKEVKERNFDGLDKLVDDVFKF